MKKIVFVINYFHPDYASTGQLMTELCRHLSKDFEITVIAAQPGYSSDFKQISTKKLIQAEVWEGIKIIRLTLPKVNKQSKLSRINYILRYFFLAIVALFKERNIDLIYTISQPPILGGLIGTIGKFIKQTKHVYNIQDFNPEQAKAINYTNPIIFYFAKLIDKVNCRFSDHIIVVGNDMKKTLEQRFNNKNVPSSSVINNWTNEKEIIPLDKNNEHVSTFIRDNQLEDKFIIMYSGNLGLFYDLENLIKITSEFENDKRVQFLFVGEGASKSTMENYVSMNNLENVTFLPYQPKEFIKYSLNVADVHLVVNQKGIKGVSVPSKIYGVMAAGKPILGVLEKGSEAEILINSSESGLVSEPQDYSHLISNIKTILEMDVESRKRMGLKGRDYLEKNLTKDTSLNRYAQILSQLTKSGRVNS